MSGDGTARLVRLDLGAEAYDVRIGAGLLDSVAESAGAALGRQIRAACVIFDRNAAEHAAVVGESLRGAGTEVVEVGLHASELEKSLATVGEALTAMGEARLERSDPVFAVGGGIVGDIGGFVAAVYRRGVPVVQCPTTLLAMVDASIGGKTGVNLGAAGALQKNMVGAFHQPRLVLADVDTLGTLPDRELRAGLAECVKHGMLDGVVGDGSHLGWIEGALEDVQRRVAERLIELIDRSARCKAAVVAGDTHETAESGGGRALLNLGHTFAHAIETIPHLSPTGDPRDAPLLHGEAVALGLVAASAASAELGMVEHALADRIAALLERCGLPTRIAGLPDDDTLLRLMGADKKTSGGRLRLVLPTPGWRAEVVREPERRVIASGWSRIRGEHIPSGTP